MRSGSITQKPVLGGEWRQKAEPIIRGVLAQLAEGFGKAKMIQTHTGDDVPFRLNTHTMRHEAHVDGKWSEVLESAITVKALRALRDDITALVVQLKAAGFIT